MEPLVIENKVIAVMGNDVDTDIIFPTRYIAAFEEAEVARHVFEDYDPGFRAKAKDGGIILAGKNFGCGSAREQAATALKGGGARLIIARSFSRSFYRNGINVGLPLLEIEKLPRDFAAEGDQLSVRLNEGMLVNLTSGAKMPFEPPSAFILAVMQAGGIFKYYQQTDGYKNIEAFSK
ncbi:MAG TPA: 3-isopropylmalate dehydratase [Anaerovoracaceae bacterium]|nr:3-isopropylmalate dehydratase [Anaerovoracaceae bacterium]